VATGLYGSTTGQNRVRAATAEFIGTFFLVFAGIVVVSEAALKLPIAGTPADSLTVGLTFGLVLTVLVYTLGHISGAHFNAAVTLALAFTKKFPWKNVPEYLIAQFAGALLAPLIVRLIFGGTAAKLTLLGATHPAPQATDTGVLIFETILPFLLVIVIIAVSSDDRVHPAVSGLAVGFALTVCVLAAGPISGGGMNPDRALGPMLVAHDTAAWWAYLFGPIIGGTAAAFVYDKFLAQAKNPSEAMASEED
jgi:MIP family channel proteins